jgi:hypothetical protein
VLHAIAVSLDSLAPDVKQTGKRVDDRTLELIFNRDRSQRPVCTLLRTASDDRLVNQGRHRRQAPNEHVPIRASVARGPRP